MTMVYASGFDRLDQICFAHYGEVHGTVEAVLDANPGLAGLGLIIPKGTPIVMPSIEVRREGTVLRLWD